VARAVAAVVALPRRGLGLRTETGRDHCELRQKQSLDLAARTGVVQSGVQMENLVVQQDWGIALPLEDGEQAAKLASMRQMLVST
jgi:hypothetical protein